MSQNITKSNKKSQKQDFKISIYPLEDMYKQLVEESKQAQVKLSHYIIHLLINRHHETESHYHNTTD